MGEKTLSQISYVKIINCGSRLKMYNLKKMFSTSYKFKVEMGKNRVDLTWLKKKTKK